MDDGYDFEDDYPSRFSSKPSVHRPVQTDKKYHVNHQGLFPRPGDEHNFHPLHCLATHNKHQRPIRLVLLIRISSRYAGAVLSNNLWPCSGKPSMMCRPLCGSLAAVLWLEWAIVESIFGEENYLWGPTIAWGMIWYWCGFALEWKTGYCYSFVEVVARLTEADCA
ncbi:hypothetical protein K449DRAFT_433947 [Hypoxylon sp. EC38]|nr:hypothetical protein K449DRAFT_433947 [Hypoxylon sp. EC38]